MVIAAESNAIMHTLIVAEYHGGRPAAPCTRYPINSACTSAALLHHEVRLANPGEDLSAAAVRHPSMGLVA